jgi:4-hydroxybenzoate polyprenyltransferase
MSQAIMKGRSPEEQKAAVLNVLNSLLPSIIPWSARMFFRPTTWACMTCAFFANIGFSWVRPLGSVSTDRAIHAQHIPVMLDIASSEYTCGHMLVPEHSAATKANAT